MAEIKLIYKNCFKCGENFCSGSIENNVIFEQSKVLLKTSRRKLKFQKILILSAQIAKINSMDAGNMNNLKKEWSIEAYHESRKFWEQDNYILIPYVPIFITPGQIEIIFLEYFNYILNLNINK